MQRSTLIKAGVALAVLWAVVLAVAKISGNQRVTPQSIREFLSENILEPAPESGEPENADERRRVIDQYADKLNRLNWKQRHELRETAHTDGEIERVFIEKLSQDEKLYLIKKTIDEHFNSMMNAFNDMSKSERAEMIRKISKDMENDDHGRRELERLKEEDKEILEQIVERGMRSYYKEANAEVKLDLAPLMQEIQERMQRLHRH